jgi:hypothetical protein
MRKHNVLLVAGIALLVLGASASARADVDLEGTLLLGSGVDTGDQPHNPYALQVGGAGELIISGWVAGFRATRAVSSGDVEKQFDLRTIGGDFGFEWELSLLHLGPRFGVGRVATKNGDWHAVYLEPGAVAEVEIGWFVAGGDLRYRIVTENHDLDGLLIYAKVGMRF